MLPLVVHQSNDITHAYTIAQRHLASKLKLVRLAQSKAGAAATRGCKATVLVPRTVNQPSELRAGTVHTVASTINVRPREAIASTPPRGLRTAPTQAPHPGARS